MSDTLLLIAMRHSSIDRTMNTYTDVRLLSTAEAVESLPSFEARRTVAPSVAPNIGQVGQTESVSDNLGKFYDEQSNHEKTPQTEGFTAIDAIGATGHR